MALELSILRQDSALGTTDARMITPENPFGLNPEDTRSTDDVLVSHPDLHLPVGQPVKALLRSKDALHISRCPSSA